MDVNNTKGIDEIKKSPIFNMSLSSKELFHSNFIGWILDTYTEDLTVFFKEKLEIKNNNSIKNIKREKLNIDISFELGDTLVLIENKVKSIPYTGQLKKYEEYEIKKFDSNCKNIKYILLTLKEPKIKSDNWIYISYKELIEYLKNMDIKNQYHHFLVHDYIDLIVFLQTNIVDNINLETNQISNLYDKDSEENKFLNKLTNIRMHDFYLKGIFEELAFETYNKLKEKFDPIQFVYGGDPVKILKGHNFLIDHGMTRSQGILEIKYKIKDIIIGVQIQGDQYRQFIEGDKDKIEDIAKKFSDEKLWFNFSHTESSKVYPLDEAKSFNRFGSRMGRPFLYKSIKINNLTNSELFEMIVKDIEHLISLNKSNIG